MPTNASKSWETLIGVGDIAVVTYLESAICTKITLGQKHKRSGLSTNPSKIQYIAKPFVKNVENSSLSKEKVLS